MRVCCVCVCATTTGGARETAVRGGQREAASMSFQLKKKKNSNVTGPGRTLNDAMRIPSIVRTNSFVCTHKQPCTPHVPGCANNVRRLDTVAKSYPAKHSGHGTAYVQSRLERVSGTNGTGRTARRYRRGSREK